MTYAQLRALQSKSRYAEMDPQMFARLMGATVGDNKVVQSGIDPSWLAQAEYGLNEVVNETGLPDAFGSLGGALFGDTGRDIFRSVPRSMLNLAPLAVSGPAGLIGAGVMGASQAWGETEQVVPSLVGGALAAATPGIAAKGGAAGVQATRGMLGDVTGDIAARMAPLGDDAVAAVASRLGASTLPRTGAEVAGMVAGEQAALLGASVAGDAVSIAADSDRSFNELANPAYWAAQAIGNLPFVGFDVVQGRRAYQAGKAEAAGAPLDLAQALFQDHAKRTPLGPQPAPRDWNWKGQASPWPSRFGESTPWPRLTETSSAWPMPQLQGPTAQWLGDPTQFRPVTPSPELEGPGSGPLGEASTTSGKALESFLPRYEQPLLGGPVASPEQLAQLMLEAPVVRPLALDSSMKQAGASEELSKASTEPRREEPEVQDAVILSEIQGEGWQSRRGRAKLRRDLNSDDPRVVVETLKKVLPAREQQWINKMWEAKTKAGLPHKQVFDEVVTIARRWGLSQLSRKRTKDRLGDKADLGRGMSARAAHKQMELNDWVEKRLLESEEDGTIGAEFELIDRVQKERLAQMTDKDANDRGVTEAFGVYRNWVEGGKQGPFENYLRSSLSKAAKTDEDVAKGTFTELDENVASGMTPEEARAVVEANVADKPEEIAKTTKAAVNRAKDRLADVIWPDTVAQNPRFQQAIKIVTDALRYGGGPETILERMRMELHPEDAAAIYDPEFMAAVRQAAIAAGMNKASVAKALDGVVDPAARAELENTLNMRAFIEAERAEPGKVTQLYNMLRSFGASKADVARELPILTKLWNFSQSFKDVDLAQLRTRDGRRSQGLFASDAAGRRIVGAQTDRPTMLSWIVGHELVGHALWDAHAKGELDPVATERLNKFRDNVRKMSPDERRRMLADAAATLPRRYRKDAEIQRLLESEIGYADPDEVMANINAIAALGLTSAKPSRIKAAVEFLPKWFADFLETAAGFGRRIIDSFRGLTTGPERKVFDEHKRNMEEIMLQSRANEITAAQLSLFETATSPGGIAQLLKTPDTADANWQDLISDPYTAKLNGDFVKFLAGDDWKNVPHLAGAAVGRGGRWLAHTLQPIIQFGELDKNFRPYAQQQQRTNNELQGHITRLMSLLGASYDGSITTLGASGPEAQLAKMPKAAVALEDALRLVQTKGEALVDLEKAKDPEMMKILGGLTSEELNTVRLAAQNKRLFHRQGAEVHRKLEYDYTAAALATSSMKSATGHDLGLEYWPTYELLQSKIEEHKAGVFDPARLASELQAMGHQPASAQSTATAFKAFLEDADSRYNHRIKFDSFINESRHGDYKVTYVDPQGVHGLVSANTREDAEFLVKKMTDLGNKEVTLADPTDFRAQKHFELTSDIEDIITAQTETLAKTLRAKGVPDALVKEVMDGFDLIQDIDRAQTSKRFGTLTVKRNFAPGRETLNMSEQQVLHVQAQLRQAQRRINEAVFHGMLRDKNFKDSPQAAAVLTSWRNNMTPDRPLTQAIGKFGYFYALAMNMPNYAQEWAQAITGFPSKLIEEGAPWMDAYRLVTKAQKDVIKMQRSPKFLKGGALDLSHLPADERAMLQEAMEQGMMGNGMLAEMTSDTIDKQFRKQKVAAGWAEDTPVSKVGEFADKTFNSVTRLHSKFTAASTSAALLASYRFARGRGMDHKAAVKKAQELFYAGMHVGGRYNRAAGLWDSGHFQPVSAAISSLQSFTTSTIASTINYARRAMDGKLAKDDRKAAASALANQLLVQTAIAGVMGLPLVGPMMAIAEKALGFDLQAEMAQMAAQSEDPEKAALWNEIALRGLSRGIGFVDIGARYGLGNVMGLNENDGFAFENMFGPVGSAIGRSVTGLGMLMKGDVLDAAAEIAPAALRKPLKLWSDDWQFRSKDGNLLLDDATPMEKAMYSLGLQPNRLNQARESYNMIKRAREREHQNEIKFSRQVADQIEEGDVMGARETLATKAEEDSMDYKDMVERVVNALETRAFQARPSRDGSRQTAELDAAITAGYRQNAPADELERERYKADLALLLGVQPNEKRLREAAVIDEMRRANPFLTVRQAKILLEKQKKNALMQQAGLSAVMTSGGAL